MRRVGAWIACAGLAATLAACTEYDYIRHGIGTNLRPSDLSEATQIQDAYVGEICRQAGFRTRDLVLADGAVVLLCDESGLRQGDWALFVQAGMNDIDRRCDSYLSWLDEKRRSSEPILKEIAKLGAETLAILKAVDAGAKSIAIVGIAFGLGADTFTNVNDVLAGLNTSTIQSTVLGNQQEFRGKLLQDANNKPVVIDNRPAAIYLLRSYLRICTPFSIGTSINNTITVFHRAGPDALKDNPSLFTAPADLAKTVIINPSAPLTVPERRRVVTPTRFGVYEQSQAMTQPHIREIQQALCVKVDGELGQRGSETRRAIGDYLVARGQPRTEVITARVDALIGDAIDLKPDCSKLKTAKAVGEAIK